MSAARTRAPIPVLVTGVGGGGHGEQILKALRLAGERYHVSGADVTPECAGRPAVDSFDLLPPASDPGYLDALAALARRRGARAVFHGSEPEMRAMSAARAALEAGGLYVPVNDPEVIAICSDKHRTMDFLDGNGFRTPRYRFVADVADIEAVDYLPVILKPAVGGGGSANVFIAQSRDELAFFSRYLLSLYPSFLVQEYVGRPDQEFTVGVLHGRDGAFINSIAVHRVINNALSVRSRVANRTGREELGPVLVVSSGVSQGRVGRFPEVVEPCERIARVLGATAPVNIQCRLVAGEVVPFEINPRFSGTTSIRAMAGYNEPDVLIRRDVLGEHIAQRFEYREMLVMRGLQEHVVAPVSDD